MTDPINIKYRTWFKGQPPQPIKLQVPGWAGDPGHDHGQPWHCKPFIDGATYGMELLYPFDAQTTVSTKDGKLVFECDFAKEAAEVGQNWDKPFSSFAPHHFGMTSSVDLKTPEGYGTMILPHPRYYTDRTNTCPLAIGGFIESDMWPRIFFVVFKSPHEGQSYVFRKGEPYCQLLFLPKQAKYNMDPMSVTEAMDRARQEELLNTARAHVATHTWKTVNDEQFDNKYKKMSAAHRKDGQAGVKNLFSEAMKKQQEERTNIERILKKFPKKVFNINDNTKS